MASLGLKIWPINVEAHKIDSSIFKTFRIVIANFQIKNKLRRSQVFQKTCLMTDINIAVILNMLFLALSNTNVLFTKQKLTWRSYIPVKALLITKQVEMIDKKKYAKIALDKNIKAFVMYIALIIFKISIYST